MTLRTGTGTGTRIRLPLTIAITFTITITAQSVVPTVYSSHLYSLLNSTLFHFVRFFFTAYVIWRHMVAYFDVGLQIKHSSTTFSTYEHVQPMPCHLEGINHYRTFRVCSLPRGISVSCVRADYISIPPPFKRKHFFATAKEFDHSRDESPSTSRYNDQTRFLVREPEE